MPSIAMGTDNLTPQKVEMIIGHGLSKGAMIDTATGYGSHPAVARTMIHHKRANIFICTKFHNGNMEATQGSVETVVDQILDELKTDYIDLLLIHNTGVKDYPTVFKNLIPIKKSGRIKSIGVSNFTIKHLHNLGEDIAQVDVNQVELHPYLQQPELIAFCKKNAIQVMAYRSLCEGKILSDTILNKIAADVGRSVAQIVLRWQYQMGMVPVVRTSSLKHLEENISIFDFVLNPAQMAAITSLDQHLRTCIGPWSDF